MPFGNRKIYFRHERRAALLSCFRGSFQFGVVTIKKYCPSGNLEFNNLGIPPSLKFRILMETILPISLKLNFTPNTLGVYGLSL